MVKNVLTVIEVVESWNTENKPPSNVKITLRGYMGTTDIGGLRILKVFHYNNLLKDLTAGEISRLDTVLYFWMIKINIVVDQRAKFEKTTYIRLEEEEERGKRRKTRTI